MVDGLDTVLWVGGIAFVICWFFRLWWVAALITAGVIAMAIQGAGSDLRLDTLLVGGLVAAIPAFSGAALGKFMHNRKADPFDPTDRSRQP